MKVNIWMADSSELKEVNIFKSKELGDSIISTRSEIEELLNFENNRTVYFGGKYIQGGIIPQRILEYEIIDDEPDVFNAILNFLDNENIPEMFGVTTEYMAKWIIKNREKLLKILR